MKYRIIHRDDIYSLHYFNESLSMWSYLGLSMERTAIDDLKDLAKQHSKDFVIEEFEL